MKNRLPIKVNSIQVTKDLAKKYPLPFDLKTGALRVNCGKVYGFHTISLKALQEYNKGTWRKFIEFTAIVADKSESFQFFIHWTI